MADPQYLSTDPNAGLPASAVAYQAPAAMHPEARISAKPADAPVTLQDLEEDPIAAMQRIGALVKADLSDPKLWMRAAAMYFAPSVFSKAAPVVMRAATAAKGAAGNVAASGVRGAAAMGDIVSPDVIGIVSPRLGRAVETAQRMRGAMPTAEPVAAPPVAPASPVGPVVESAAPPPLEESRPVPQGKSPQQLLNEEAIARRRAAYASRQQVAAPAPTPEPLKPPMLKASETKEYLRLIKAGKTSREALEAIQAQREFAEKFGLSTPSVEETRFPKGMRGKVSPR